MSQGFDISTTQEEKYALVIAVAEGKKNFEEIKAWISVHIKKHV